MREEGVAEEIVAVNGCIYGREPSSFKSDADADKSYFKYAGQTFWHFLSGDDDLYRQIIVPIDVEAKSKDAAFRTAYVAKVNELTLEFAQNFVSEGQIDWPKLIEYVSGRDKVVLQRAPKVEKNAEEQIKAAKQKVVIPARRKRPD